jgi:hypothetical protein
MRTSSMRTTSSLTLAAVAAIATLTVAPVMAANDQAGPGQMKHSMTMHKQHQVSLRTRGNGGPTARHVANPRDANANLNLSNANASADRPTESLATQYGNAFTKVGGASGPICKPGDLVPMPDGQNHPCQ